jgi:CBS domain-containing protein
VVKAVLDKRSPSYMHLGGGRGPNMTLPVDMNNKYAVRLLAKFGVSRSLVLDENRAPVGIVTLRDMVLRHADGKPAM